MESFNLCGDDIVGLSKESDNDTIVVCRPFFHSYIVLLYHNSLSVGSIKLSNNVQTLPRHLAKDINFFGPLRKTSWRVKLIVSSPVVGGQFIKYWDAGRFTLID